MWIILDQHTVRLHTAAPRPMLPYDLSPVWIVSHAIAGEAATSFDSGTAMLGTGPFRLVQWVKGERLIMERNEHYWGPKPAWKRVVMQFIPNDTARVAALLAGDVDLIELVPPSAIAELRNDPKLRVAAGISGRVIFLQIDSYRERTPFVTDLASNPLATNPFRDWRVRKAISKAIDRKTIVEKIMEGTAVPAGQFVPDDLYGASPNLRAEPYDPEGARALLAEAGYPNGFGITLQAPNNRYVSAEKVAIAIGQMLSRVGIQTQVQGMPDSILKSRAAKLEFSLYMAGWSTESAEASAPLRAMVAMPDPSKGWGFANRRYSNPHLDELLQEAMITVNDDARAKLLHEAMETAMEDTAVVPLYFEGAAWAFRKGLVYKPRLDQFTLAHEVKREP